MADWKLWPKRCPTRPADVNNHSCNRLRSVAQLARARKIGGTITSPKSAQESAPAEDQVCPLGILRIF
eukprot:9668841-Alexandrium_andersonii.AAC.1